jgi:hypothetical protein
MSNQSSLLQRSYSEEDLEKLRHLMSFRTYPDFTSDAAKKAVQRVQEERRAAADKFWVELNKQCDE